MLNARDYVIFWSGEFYNSNLIIFENLLFPYFSVEISWQNVTGVHRKLMVRLFCFVCV
jgi:hypothetical protein